jgi:uncharacterized protein
MAIATLLVHPAFAEGVDCNRTHDPVAQMICAYPKVRALDSRLSSAYAAALVREPSRADDLKRDEINWLGERNREIGWLLESQRKFPSLPSDLETTLAESYESRIAFLSDVNNPAVTRNLPIAQRLLVSAMTLPIGETDTLKALQAAGAVVLPEQHNTQNPEDTITMLAAPPDAALRAALDHFRLYPYTVVYFPSVGLGGAFNVEGTADCQYWVVFEKQGNATVPVSGTRSDFLGGCMRDDGSTGYLALIDGRPVALTVTNYPAFENVTDFQWRRWLGGSKWGPSTRIRFRYSYRLELPSKAHCPRTSPKCAVIAGVALSAAQRYMHDALTLANRVGETGFERARFKQMLRLAPNRADWADCAYPVWFPARFEGKVALGGIADSHIACHPDGSSLDVGLWGTRGNGAQWWFVDNTIDVDRHGLLFAALMPLSAKRH